jgi:preprotein translocase subunit SecB
VEDSGRGDLTGAFFYPMFQAEVVYPGIFRVSGTDGALGIRVAAARCWVGLFPKVDLGFQRMQQWLQPNLAPVNGLSGIYDAAT